MNNNNNNTFNQQHQRHQQSPQQHHRASSLQAPFTVPPNLQLPQLYVLIPTATVLTPIPSASSIPQSCPPPTVSTATTTASHPSSLPLPTLTDYPCSGMSPFSSLKIANNPNPTRPGSTSPDSILSTNTANTMNTNISTSLYPVNTSQITSYSINHSLCKYNEDDIRQQRHESDTAQFDEHQNQNKTPMNPTNDGHADNHNKTENDSNHNHDNDKDDDPDYEMEEDIVDDEDDDDEEYTYNDYNDDVEEDEDIDIDDIDHISKTEKDEESEPEKSRVIKTKKRGKSSKAEKLDKIEPAPTFDRLFNDPSFAQMTRFKLRCHKCDKLWFDRKQYIAHLKKHFGPKEYLHCDICVKDGKRAIKCKHIGNYISHIAKHYEKTVHAEDYRAFSCGISINGVECGHKSTTGQNLAKHIYVCHYKDVYDEDGKYAVNEKYGWHLKKYAEQQRRKSKNKSNGQKKYKKKKTKKVKTEKKGTNKKRKSMDDTDTATVSTLDSMETVKTEEPPRKKRRVSRVEGMDSMDNMEDEDYMMRGRRDWEPVSVMIPGSERYFNMDEQAEFVEQLIKAAAAMDDDGDDGDDDRIKFDI